MTDWAWCFDNPKEAAAEIDRLTSKLDSLEEWAGALTDEHELCDTCGSLAIDTTDADGDGNPLGHVQCGQCSQIADLEDRLRSAESRLNHTAVERDLARKERDSLSSQLEQCKETGQRVDDQLVAAQRRLEASMKMLDEVKRDLMARANFDRDGRVVGLSATLWHRLCDFLVEKQEIK